MLYIVSTPIGNLEDITLRAISTLKMVDFIACEDTRHTKKLLQALEIQTPLLSYHSHSGRAKIEKILSLLEDGKKIALVSDAGTPGISDPGYSLVSEVAKNNIPISPLPGPSAFLAALQSSGLAINKFQYLGFIPTKKGRQTFFSSIQEYAMTSVFYESVHRIQKTLEQMQNFIDHNRQVVIARELTKMHEEFIRCRVSELHIVSQKLTCKGEFVVIVGPVEA